MTRSDRSLEPSRLALDGRGHLIVGHADGALRIWDRSAAAPGSPEGTSSLRQ